MRKKLIIITISQIQEFIRNNNKVKELYKASNIVKKIVHNIYKELQKNNRISFIIPKLYDSVSDSPTMEDLPNFILAEIENDLEEDVLERDIREKINAISSMPKECQELLVFVAVVTMSEHTYMENYQRLMKKLQGYKANRLLGQYTGGKQQQSKKEEIKAPSTSTIASMQWRQKNKEKVKEIDKIKKEIIIDIDKELFEEIYYKEDVEKYKKKNNRLKEKLNEVKNCLSKIGEPSSYYSLVRMDIDNLGTYLSGENCTEEIKRRDLQEFHTRIYQCFGQYGVKVRTVLDKIEILGKENRKEVLSIYTGGDDILFFCPLHKIIEVLKEIKEVFVKETDKLKKYLKPGVALSFSTSIVIAHRKNPLKQVVQISQQKLEAVKQYYEEQEKGGIALTMIYRGGNVKACFLKGEEAYPVMGNTVQVFQRNGVVSKSFLYALQAELQFIPEEIDTINCENLYKIVKSEIKRISERKIKGQGEGEQTNMFLESLELFITNNILCIKYYLDFLNIAGKWASELEEDESEALC